MLVKTISISVLEIFRSRSKAFNKNSNQVEAWFEILLKCFLLYLSIEENNSEPQLYTEYIFRLSQQNNISQELGFLKSSFILTSATDYEIRNQVWLLFCSSRKTRKCGEVVER